VAQPSSIDELPRSQSWNPTARRRS
jgi:hypothetical protein